MEERKLLMRLPAGRRYIIEYDKTGASLVLDRHAIRVGW